MSLFRLIDQAPNVGQNYFVSHILALDVPLVNASSSYLHYDALSSYAIFGQYYELEMNLPRVVTIVPPKNCFTCLSRI